VEYPADENTVVPQNSDLAFTPDATKTTANKKKVGVEIAEWNPIGRETEQHEKVHM